MENYKYDIFISYKHEVLDKAGAAALVEMVDNACVLTEKQVILNRPFMYMILDNETMLPLFAGIYTGV